MSTRRRSAQKPTIIESDSEEESGLSDYSSEASRSNKRSARKRVHSSRSNGVRAKKARRSGNTSKADEDEFDLDEQTSDNDDDDDSELSAEGESDFSEAEQQPRKKTSIKKQTKESRAVGTKYSENVQEIQKAPTSGHVPDGQVSPNTMHLLEQLCIPKNNDRDWLALHDPLYRYCLKNWASFVDALMPDMIEQDETLPWLPSRETVYRMYRDVRFSNDKTPFKTNMSATFSRGGRKGPYAGYHLVIQPGGRSGIYGGMWCPEKEILSKLRLAFKNQSALSLQIKSLLARKEFINHFGPPKRDGLGKGKRSSLWGREDELKNAPKMEGVDKTHPEIEFLRLRSFVLGKTFDDQIVLSPTFRKEICKVVGVIAEFVQTLNEICFPDDLPPPPSSDNGSGDEEENDDEEVEGESE